MPHNILITGGSGYLGGTLLARLSGAQLPPYGKLYALVRTTEQATSVQGYDAEALRFDTNDASAILQNLLDNKISVVFHLHDAGSAALQVLFIKALAEVKRRMGRNVYFLHTSGAKMFSSHAGIPTDRELRDDEPDLFEIQRAQKAAIAPMQAAINANNQIIEQAEQQGVCSYIFIPCIVYGKGEGFGNPISIQTVAIVKAAKAAGRVYRTDAGRPSWPICHVLDTTALYIEILRSILVGQNARYGKNGYYVAASGSMAWDDIYGAIATALAKRGVIDSEIVEMADQAALERMGNALGCPPEFVAVQLGGNCTITAENGKHIGWCPSLSANHVLEAADDEVEWILKNLKY